MKILHIALLLGILTGLTACATDNTTAANVSSVFSVQGTKWHYKDEQWQYDLEFAEGGILHSQQPNDKTPNDDSWTQEGTAVNIYYNNKYSQYSGTLLGNNQISGTAKNNKGKTWTWSATRVE